MRSDKDGIKLRYWRGEGVGDFQCYSFDENSNRNCPETGSDPPPEP